jgi:hypothetical protein
MHRLWEPIIESVVRRVPARAVVEIGSQHGYLTRRLLDHYAGSETAVHVIDPAPAYDSRSWSAHYGERFVFHRDLSLNVLGHLPTVDIAFVDGDHNWYTVYNELRLLESRAREAEHQMPVVLLHDIGWPYGRRDLYYDPDTVPVDERQPNRRAGMLPGRSAPVEGDGINGHLVNAEHEGGPRNGVRTAIEDFLRGSDSAKEILAVPGLHGLSILAPPGSLFEELRARLTDPALLIDHLQRVEDTRIAELVRSRASARRAASKAKAPGTLAETRRELKATRRTLRAQQHLASSLGRDLDRIARDVELRERRTLRLRLRRAVTAMARRTQDASPPPVVQALRHAAAKAEKVERQSGQALSRPSANDPGEETRSPAA